MTLLSQPAVLLIAFNRPECFRQLINSVRVNRPQRVYVAIDGPREAQQHPAEARLCQETRQLIKLIDWPCQLQTRFQTTNLGCAQAVSTAIDWFFSHEPEGIILEDDCIPAPAFFPFCAQMLERYRDDARIMHINGCNLNAPLDLAGGQPYCFSHLAIIWGWATWRRAWQGYSVHLFDADIPARRRLQKPGLSAGHAYGIRSKLLKLARKKFSTWDYQWMFKVMSADGLCPTPANNLIKNIGFGSSATLTTRTDSELARMEYGNGHHAQSDWAIPRIQTSSAMNRHLAVRCFGANHVFLWKMFKNWLRRRDY